MFSKTGDRYGGIWVDNKANDLLELTEEMLDKTSDGDVLKLCTASFFQELTVDGGQGSLTESSSLSQLILGERTWELQRMADEGYCAISQAGEEEYARSFGLVKASNKEGEV